MKSPTGTGDKGKWWSCRAKVGPWFGLLCEKRNKDGSRHLLLICFSVSAHSDAFHMEASLQNMAS